MRRSPVFLCICAAAWLLLSCERQSGNGQTDNPQALADEADSAPKWIPTEKRIMLLLGYGYNTPDFITEASQTIRTYFGFAEDGGSVSILVYPDDFKRGSTARISDLKDKIEETETDGLVIFGAPENTHSAIGRIQDNFEGEHTFPVFSLFPQDDILGTQNVSDIVIEGGHHESDSSELAVSMHRDSIGILRHALEAIIRAPERIAPSELDYLAEQITQGQRIKRFVDGETGLQAANHFIIEDEPDAPQQEAEDE